MKSKKILTILATSFLLSSLIGCTSLTITNDNNTATTTAATDNRSTKVDTPVEDSSKVLDDISIVYTNDTHTYIDNMIKDDDGNETKGLSFANIAGYVENKRANGEHVLLVDAGDHIQGTAYGGLDEGRTILKIMNAAGYQAAAIGNHEFDYGQFRFFEMLEEADFPHLSCNFYNVGDNSLVLDGYKIFEVGNVKVAIVGVSTPDTISKTTPTYFQNEKGEFIYEFYRGTDGQELYDAVQKTLDEVKDQADYVIGLGHLGVDISSQPYTSREVISHTTGFDAFIDGHSHTLIEAENVTDASGNTVVLTQAGGYFNVFGDMEISNGTITCSLIDKYDEVSSTVNDLEQEWIEKAKAELAEKIAVSDVNFYINDANDPEKRLIRRTETNLGDLCADSIYWYINEKSGLNCDVAIANGGGIRCDVPEGDWSYLTAKNVLPFGNVICLTSVTGQQLKDALEMGARWVGQTNPETGEPAELGAFLHVAGLKYTIDSSISSTLQLSSDDIYAGSPTAEYKVSDIEIYNKETADFEPLDLDKIYTLGGISYLLRNFGDGFFMFNDSELVLDYIEKDDLCLANYMMSFSGKDDNGYPHISTINSPLSSFENYPLDYENPLGSGRITIK